MNVRVCMAALVAIALMLAGPQAQAFFPWGGFNQAGQLKYLTWSLDYLDGDRDGDVSGPTDGVQITFEGEHMLPLGNNVFVEDGWTPDELVVLREAFDVWQDVPTSYMAFRYTNPITEPLIVPDIDGDIIITEGIVGIDLINYVAVVVPGEGTLPTGVLGITLMTAVVDDVILTVDGVGYPITGGQVIECDILLDGPSHRAEDLGDEPEYSLLATQVHEIGHMIGLGHTPLNNFSEAVLWGDMRNLEERVYAQRNALGALELVGVTPTMYPHPFFIDEGNGEFTDGASDLAPDDMAGVSFLYPRGSQNLYFTISQEARTQGRTDFPSIPYPGAHIVAWSDADNNVTTKRVPLFSTMTGLYENQEVTAGKFELRGLLKQHETLNGSVFNATYVITSNPLNGLDPTGYPPDAFDSTHMLPGGAGAAFSYINAQPSEVFCEGGNILGVEQREQGTPLTFDPLRNQIVSANSGKTLATLLPGTKPMFGFKNDTCVLNMVVAGLATNNTPTAFRGFRDTFLLNTTVGAALVDAYYRVSPSLVEVLARHDRMRAALHSLFAGFEWMYIHAEVLLMAGLVLLSGAVLLKLRRARRAGTLAGLVILASLLVCGSPAHALLKNMTTPEIVDASDDILMGKVETVESFWLNSKVIVTEITVNVSDTVKGEVNKSANVHLRQLGGRVGSVVSVAHDLPAFEKGQEVVLFLEKQELNAAKAVVCGARGKYEIVTDPATGKKSVRAGSLEAKVGMRDVVAKLKGEKAKDGAKDIDDDQVPLDDFKAYLKEVVREQKKAPVKAEE